MKKISVQRLAFFVFLSFSLFGCSAHKPIVQANVHIQNSMVGTWQLCNYNTLEPDSAIGGRAGAVRYKMITATKFIVIESKLSNNALVGSFSGWYTMNDGTYVETVDNKAPNIYGKNDKPTNTFKVKFDGKLLYLNGVDNSYHEVWKRVD